MSKEKAIAEFKERVIYLPDQDYGDFKRKLDLEMAKLWRTLGHDDKATDEAFWKLKKEIVYKAELTVEEARELALTTIENL